MNLEDVVAGAEGTDSRTEDADTEVVVAGVVERVETEAEAEATIGGILWKIDYWLVTSAPGASKQAIREKTVPWKEGPNQILRVNAIVPDLLDQL